MESKDTDYATQLAQWKRKHGLDPQLDQNEAELIMAGEEQNDESVTWCVFCDAERIVKELRLITRRIDPYVQIDDGPEDYIKRGNRVRACSPCFNKHYSDL